jgi:tryptophan 2,3-dioxygenase
MPSEEIVEEEPGTYGAGDLTYNDYLKVPELLTLQQLLSQPPHHDEMLFIVIHQTYELWFKLILHELEKTIELMQQQHVLRARHFLSRVVKIMQLLVKQIHILETMTAADFLQFRDRLKPASGFQSVQFRELEFIAGLKDERYLRMFADRPQEQAQLQRRYDGPDLRQSYYEMLSRMGFAIPEDVSRDTLQQNTAAAEQLLDSLRTIYENPIKQMPLYVLSESLVDFDQQLSLWRHHHVQVVERIIGAKPGTGGSSGVSYLRTTTDKRCFPYLWRVRTRLEKR